MKEESHQEHSARLPYLPQATAKCPMCQSEMFYRCRCPTGDHFCPHCDYEWRTGQLYWLLPHQQEEMNKKHGQ